MTGAVASANNLPRWAKQGFATKYPGIPLAECWVITIGQDEPTELRADKLLIHGIVAMLAAGAMIACWTLWRRLVSRSSKSSGGNPQVSADSVGQFGRA